MLKKPKFEMGKLMKPHDEGSSSGKATGDKTGAKVEWADGYEPLLEESVLFNSQTFHSDKPICDV